MIKTAGNQEEKLMENGHAINLECFQGT